MASSHRVTYLEKNPVRISKDEAPTPLSVVGPLFISSLLFHLSRALLGAWRFSFFVLFSLAFTKGWTSSGSLAFIGCFILFSQFIVVCICKNENVWFVLVQQTSDFVASLGLGLGQLPVLVIHCLFFSLRLPFCFSRSIVHLRCTSKGVVSMFNEIAHSFFVWGSSSASVSLPCCCHC